MELAKNLFHWCAIFRFTWCTIVVFMILQNPHILGKPISQSYIRKCSRSIRLQDFLNFNTTKTILRYKVPLLNVVKFSWKLQFDHVIFFGFSQACPKCSEKNRQYRFWRKIWSVDVIFLVLNNTPPLRIYKNHMALKNLVLEW